MVNSSVPGCLFNKVVSIDPFEYPAGIFLLGKINMLEYTMGWRNCARRNEKPAGNTIFIQPDYLARLDFTNELRSDGI